MNSIKNEICLSRYKCAQCGRTPESDNEVLNGCVCGHRLFRIILQKPHNSSKFEKIPKICLDEDKDFLTIREREVGVFDINVKKLMDIETEEKIVPIVAGNKGIFTIKLDYKKKNNP